MALQFHINVSPTDLQTARGVAHLVVHGTSVSTSYETIPHVRLESSGGVLSTVDMVVQRRDGPRRLRDHDDDDDDDDDAGYCSRRGARCLRDTIHCRGTAATPRQLRFESSHDPFLIAGQRRRRWSSGARTGSDGIDERAQSMSGPDRRLSGRHPVRAQR